MTFDNHPFFKPLDDLTIDELDKKYADIMNRWRIARSMNMEQQVLYQLDLMLSSIEAEKQKRIMADDKPDGVVGESDPIPNLPNVYPNLSQVKPPKKP